MNEISTINSDKRQELFEISKSAFSPYDEPTVIGLLDSIYVNRREDEREEQLRIMESAAAECRVTMRFNSTLKQYKEGFAMRRRSELAPGFVEVTHYPKGYEMLFECYLCGDWIVNDSGICKIVNTKGGEVTPVKICSQPIVVVERLRNRSEGIEKIVLAYTIGSKWEFITVEREIIASNTKIVRLANSSIDVTSETARDLIKYLQYILQVNSDKIPVYNTVNRLGWVNREFVPYSSSIKCDCLSKFKPIVTQLQSNGAFETWKEHCTALRDNIYMRLVMAASFSAPLIKLVGALPFIVHLWGGTGAGKTVALCVAASIWGNGSYDENSYITSFGATDYSLDEFASLLYSLPCLVDEGQIKKGEEFDRLIMKLAEGKGKMQGAASGGIKELRHWTNCFITTAEENIVKYNSGGGTANRVISIEAKSKVVANGNYTMQIISKNHGFAGKIYIDYLQKMSEDKLRKRYNEIFAALKKESDSTDKQCMAMAVILLADELSGDCIFTDAPPLHIQDVIPFMTSSKDVDNAERAYEWIMNWISQNINRFRNNDFNNGEVWGKIDGDIVAVNKNVLSEHLQRAGFDYGAVMPELARRNKIVKTKQGKWLHSACVYGAKGSYIKLISVNDEFVDIIDNKSPWNK